MKTVSKKLASAMMTAAFLIAGTVLPTSASAAVSLTTVTLKSALANKSNLLAFHNAIAEARFASLLERNQAFQNLDLQADIVKSDIIGFATRIKANNEVTAFNTNVLIQAAKFGGKVLVNEINADGGPYAILVKSGLVIDQDVKQLKSDFSLASALPSITQLLGISDAQAGIRSTACGAFWFVISLGYAERMAYESCHKY